MSATDELRRLLDERGIAWRSIANDGCATEYTHGGVLYRAYETYGGFQVSIITRITPEQVIAAMVGCKTCELVNAGDGKCICFGCGYRALDELWNGFRYCPICGRRVV